MPLKRRVRHALKQKLVFGILYAFAVMIIRPEGQSLTFHYMLHQLWPFWVLIALPAYFLGIYYFDPKRPKNRPENAAAPPTQSPEKP